MTRDQINAALRIWTDERERAAWLCAWGWFCIGRGCFKIVYGHADASFVVKLHTDDCGSFEVENYETAPDSIRPFLVPVEQYPGYQLQDRITMLSCPKRGCEIEGMNDSDNRNHTHAPNGDPIIFDYGQSDQWGDNDHYSDDECDDEYDAESEAA